MSHVFVNGLVKFISHSIKYIFSFKKLRIIFLLNKKFGLKRLIFYFLFLKKPERSIFYIYILKMMQIEETKRVNNFLFSKKVLLLDL